MAACTSETSKVTEQILEQRRSQRRNLDFEFSRLSYPGWKEGADHPASSPVSVLCFSGK